MHMQQLSCLSGVMLQDIPLVKVLEKQLENAPSSQESKRALFDQPETNTGSY